MTNPFETPVQCECGHEDGDHWTPDSDTWRAEDSVCMFCKCREFQPKDDYYYAQLAEDIAMERADARRKGYD